MMPANSQSPSRRNSSVRSAILSAFMMCLLMPACCAAFPVDFVLTEVRQKDPPPADAEQTEEAAPAEKADASEKAVPADKAVAADRAADEKTKPVPVKRGNGVVRKKAVAVAEGAAEAAEEVGQVIGNLLGGLFGRRGGGGGAQVQNAALNAQALKQFEARYGRHFDQIVRTELHFIRVVCKPTRQQYEAMASDGKLIRTKVLNKFALIQQGQRQGRSSSDNSDTRKPVATELLISAKRHLSAEQVAAYESEIAERNEARKDTGVLAIAAKLDRKLVLTADQRDKTVTMLDDNWKESWGSTSLLMYGDQYFPDVPDPKLIPILTKTQQNVWRTVNQQNRISWGFNVGMAAGVAIADEEWEEAAEEVPVADGQLFDRSLEADKESKEKKPAESEDDQAAETASALPAAEGSK